MFNVLGGTYARDNFPGLTMVDPLTGLLFIAGLVALIRNFNASFARLMGCTFVLNFIPAYSRSAKRGHRTFTARPR